MSPNHHLQVFFSEHHNCHFHNTSTGGQCMSILKQTIIFLYFSLSSCVSLFWRYQRLLSNPLFLLLMLMWQLLFLLWPQPLWARLPLHCTRAKSDCTISTSSWFWAKGVLARCLKLQWCHNENVWFKNWILLLCKMNSACCHYSKRTPHFLDV